jgi:hypothetical protein
MKRILFLLAALLCAGPIIGPKPALATVNTSANSTNALGNGTQTVFSFTFIGIAPANIRVLLTDSSGNQTTLTQGSGPSQYSVTVNSAVQGATFGVGGSVTYPNSGTPVPAGSTLTIYRTLPLTQSVSLQNQASYGQYARSAEQMGDLIEMQLQQVYDTIGRALVMNPANSVGPAVLPPAAQMANLALCGDSTGLNVIACTVPVSGIISSAMQPVVSAASLAAGRTAFGLGTIATESIGAGLQDNGSGSLRVNAAFSTDASNTSVTSAFHMTQRRANGPITYTLPRANTLWSGFGFWIYPRAGVVTLSIDANDSLPGQASGVGLALPANTAVYISTDGAASGNWYLQIANVTTPASGSTALTSGSGTYTTPANAVRLRIRMVGAGGGGAGIGTGTTAAAGGNGGTTTFGVFTAIGGNGGAPNNGGTGGDGGIGGTGGAGSAFLRIKGQAGGVGLTTTAAAVVLMGGVGGSSPFGGAGSPSLTSLANRVNATTNSGSGGAGGEANIGTNGCGGGGGAGEYVEFEMTSPASSYSYAIGAAGAAGAAGTSGADGGVGGSGAIYIQVLYN